MAIIKTVICDRCRKECECGTHFREFLHHWSPDSNISFKDLCDDCYTLLLRFMKGLNISE